MHTQALLAAGANPKLKGSYGETPTWLAARWGTVSILKALLEAGGSLLDMDSEGQTPVAALCTCPISRLDDAEQRLELMVATELGLDISK